MRRGQRTFWCDNKRTDILVKISIFDLCVVEVEEKQWCNSWRSVGNRRNTPHSALQIDFEHVDSTLRSLFQATLSLRRRAARTSHDPGSLAPSDADRPLLGRFLNLASVSRHPPLLSHTGHSAPEPTSQHPQQNNCDSHATCSPAERWLNKVNK